MPIEELDGHVIHLAGLRQIRIGEESVPHTFPDMQLRLDAERNPTT